MRTNFITISSIAISECLWLVISTYLLQVVHGGLRGKSNIDENENSTVSSYIIDMNNMQSMINEPSDIYTAKTCIDFHTDCYYWAKEGGCIKDPLHLLSICPKSCKSCGFIPNPEDSKKILKYGVVQRVEGDTYVDILKNIQSTVSYMERMKLASTLSEDIFKKCRNEHGLCSFWATAGECESNTNFMTEHCSPSCQSCHLIDFETRCPHRDPHLKPAVENKGLDKIFLSMLNRDNLHVQVHSRPDEYLRRTDYKQRPWVITIDNFLSSKECDQMIDLGYSNTLKNHVITQDIIGSTNTFCMKENGCSKHPITQSISKRISDLLTIPLQNFVYLNINKITPSYSVKKYHNLAKHQIDSQCGPSIISITQFLSDAPNENQGGIHFYVLNKTIAAKKGRVVIWPNVVNSDMTRKDIRMFYYTQAISEGVMYYARSVAHLYDYVTPHARGCIQ